MQLRAGQILYIPGEQIQHVYFPRDAVLAMLVQMEDGEAIEGATIGNEGVVRLPLFFGDSTSTLEMAALARPPRVAAT